MNAGTVVDHTDVRARPLAGLSAVIRLQLRRHRWLLLLWIVVLGLLPVAVGAAGADAAYPTDADKVAFATTAAAQPAQLATRGPVFAATTGGLTAWTLASSGVLLTGLVSLLLVIQQTRAEEQSGRQELLGSAVLGRCAPVAAALVVVIGGNLAVGALAGVTLIGYGLPAAGSVAFGATLAAGGTVFAAVGALAAQLVQSAGSARAIGLVVLAVSLVVAAIGEISHSWVVWASPLGWARRVQAFAGDRWWVLLLFVVLAALLTAVAVSRSARRDLGAGLLPARPGRDRAARWLKSPLSLAWFLQRPPLLAWTAGFLILGTFMGVTLRSVGPQLDTPAFRALAAAAGGGDPAEWFFGGLLFVLAEVATASVVAAALGLRAQETNGPADLLLATPTGRIRWMLAHWAVTALGAVIVLTALGLGAGLGYGTPAAILGRTLAFLPACLVFAGLVAALTGWLPRLAAPVTWGVLGAIVLLDFLAEFGLAGDAVLSLSPFLRIQLALVDGQGLTAAILGLTGLAAALTTVGVIGIRHRDLG